MRDIAAQLGLSVSTVSLALRAAPQVAEETRVLVRDTAVRMGYIQRPRQKMPTTLTNIAFVTPSDPGNDFYGVVLTGAESECRRHRMMLHFVRLDHDGLVLPELYDSVDGLLIVGSVSEDVVGRIQASELPLVLVDNNLPSLGVDRILIENTSSLYQTTLYLARKGHQEIAFLCGSYTNVPSFKERLIGYRLAMADLGLQPIELFFQDIESHDVESIMSAWIQSRQELGFTALIGCNDKSTLAALHALHDHNIRVPDDVSMVGFDDIDMARMVRPMLTTNHVYREQLGRCGIQRLIERAREPEAPAQGLMVETKFIERDSVRPRRS
jgi:DNA-binding LacI/PurR family transcriptional regulator